MSVRITTVIVLTGLVGVALTPVALSTRVKAWLREAVVPVQEVSTRAFDRLALTVRMLKSAGGASESRRDLRQRIATLELELAQSREAAQQAEALRRQLDYRERSPYALIPAEVIARGDPAGWWAGIRINRGLGDGVVSNAPVISEEGLVGMVRDVTARTADILLLTDGRMRLGCRLRGTDTTGILRGMGPSANDLAAGETGVLSLAMPLWLDYIPPGATVSNGAVIETSGMGGLIPAGLTVGVVQRAHPDASRLFLRADVAPAADLRLLRYVYVIRQSSGEGEP